MLLVGRDGRPRPVVRRTEQEAYPMVCDWCHTPCDPDKAERQDRLVFHPECLWAFREYLQAIKDESDAEIKAQPAERARS
jgi:hypothetical protein